MKKNGANSRSSGKLRNGARTESSLEDLGKPEDYMKFSEESSRTIHELVNIETYDLGQISRTVQCHSCLKYILEGLTICSSGVCFRLDEETIHRIKARFQALIVPYYLARVNHSRGKKHGKAQWQQDHWNAVNAKRGAWKHNKNSIVIRWQEDEKYRNSQQGHGWTEEDCRYLDYLTTINISYIATWQQTHGY